MSAGAQLAESCAAPGGPEWAARLRLVSGFGVGVCDLEFWIYPAFPVLF